MKFLTFTQASKEVGLPASRLRQMQKQGRCPGLFAGTRYYVDVDSLLAQLAAECTANAQGITGEDMRA